MKPYGAYNCVLASVYNELTLNGGLHFPFEAIPFAHDFFAVTVWKEWLVVPSPERTVHTFLRGIAADLAFPDLGDLPGAVAYIDGALARGRVVPVSINLLHSHFDPTTFSNDYWNFQLVTGREAAEGEPVYRMFDMYHSQSYVVPRAKLVQMIDTPFNRRFGDAVFTPTFTVELADRALAEERLGRIGERERWLEAIGDYPLADNLAQGEEWIARCAAKFAELPQERFHDEIYQTMGHLILIQKSREHFGRYSEKWGVPEPESADLLKRWNAFVNKFPMTCGRRQEEGFAELRDAYRALIEEEDRYLAGIRQKAAAAS